MLKMNALYTYPLLASLISKKPNRALQYMYTLMQPYMVIYYIFFMTPEHHGNCAE